MSPYGRDSTWSSGRIASPSGPASWRRAAAAAVGVEVGVPSAPARCVAVGSAPGSRGSVGDRARRRRVGGRLVLAVARPTSRVGVQRRGGLPSASRRTASSSAGSTTQVTGAVAGWPPKSTRERSRPPWASVWVQPVRSSSEPSSRRRRLVAQRDHHARRRRLGCGASRHQRQEGAGPAVGDPSRGRPGSRRGRARRTSRRPARRRRAEPARDAELYGASRRARARRS